MDILYKVPADGFNALTVHCAVLSNVCSVWWSQQVISNQRPPNFIAVQTPVWKTWTGFYDDGLEYLSSVNTEVIFSHWILTAEGEAVPWLRRFVAGLSPRRPGFNPGVNPRGICGGQSGIGIGFLQVLRFSPVNFIPP
jgi:hypothetical protein